jgi:hypothetical protein
MAYSLGKTANPLISNMEAAYADDVPQQVLSSDSLIVVGKSSTIPLLSKVNDKLPAPFDLKSDTANESNMQIVYRIPKGMSVGYLELLNSPFNASKPMLVLAGNSDDGVNLAGNTLLQPTLSNQLSGVFAVTNGTQVATAQALSAFSAVGTLVPPAQAVITTPVPVSSAASVALQPPAWLLPILVVSGVAILLIIVLVGANALSRKRTETAKAFTPSNQNSGDNGRTH